MIFFFAFVAFIFIASLGFWIWPLAAAALGITRVTDKPSALLSIRQQMLSYDISPSEVEHCYKELAKKPAEHKRSSQSSIAKTLFSYIGAVFLVAGVGIYISDFWGSMGSAMRIFSTLGVGYALLIVLLAALHEKKYPKLIFPLSIASALMMCRGFFVFADELKGLFVASQHLLVLVIFTVMAFHQGALLFFYRQTVHVILSLFFLYGSLSLGFQYIAVPWHHAGIVLGVSLFVVGVGLEKTKFRGLAGPALFISFCWLYPAVFMLFNRHWQADWALLQTGACMLPMAYALQRSGYYLKLQALLYLVASALLFYALGTLVLDTPFELVFLFVALSTFYASVVLHSKVLLCSAAMAALSFIGHFSSTHFANSVGWPVTLIILGVACLGVGAIFIKVNRQI